MSKDPTTSQWWMAKWSGPTHAHIRKTLARS